MRVDGYIQPDINIGQLRPAKVKPVLLYLVERWGGKHTVQSFYNFNF
jgi:hypothetical protein